MEMVHQFWMGKEMPDRFRKWTSSVREWSACMSFDYHLWNGEEFLTSFAGDPIIEILRQCCLVLPTPNTYGFFSDAFRLMVTARYGGLFLDADTDCRREVSLPREGLWCSRERHPNLLPSHWFLWAPGDTGRDAAALALETARIELLKQLPLGAKDLPTRYISLLRRDKVWTNSSASNLLGPGVWRNKVMPALQAQGIEVKVVGKDVASCYPEDRPALLQCNAWSWQEHGADWEGRYERAVYREKVQEEIRKGSLSV